MLVAFRRRTLKPSRLREPIKKTKVKPVSVTFGSSWFGLGCFGRLQRMKNVFGVPSPHVTASMRADVGKIACAVNI